MVFELRSNPAEFLARQDGQGEFLFNVGDVGFFQNRNTYINGLMHHLVLACAKKIDLEKRTVTGETPLHKIMLYICDHFVWTTQFFIDLYFKKAKDEQVDFTLVDAHGANVLHYALNRIHKDSKPDRDNVRWSYNTSLVLKACCQSIPMDQLITLLTQKYQDRTPLEYAYETTETKAFETMVDLHCLAQVAIPQHILSGLSLTLEELKNNSVNEDVSEKVLLVNTLIKRVRDLNSLIRDDLCSAAANGGYNKFVQTFEKGLIHVDEYHNGGSEGKTFLHLLIENDTQSKNHSATIGRQKIAKYLLNIGADINKRGFDITGDCLPSPLELYNEQLKNDHNNASFNIRSIFQPKPTNGSSIFSVFNEHIGTSCVPTKNGPKV